MAYCTHCGKQIAEEAVICLNCGCMTGMRQTYGRTQPVADAPPALATWAKICGIISFFIGWLALGITAIVLANMSREETGGVMCADAKAGLVCGIVSCVLSFVLLVTIISITL